MKLELYTSAFCAPCHASRAVVAEAQALVPALVVDEADVAARPDQAEAQGITSTPTMIVFADDGTEVFRAAGAPRLDQVLGALALAV